jgi:hypothetical protein
MIKTYIKKETEDYLSVSDLIKIKYDFEKPIKKLIGNFEGEYQYLTSLEGSPEYVSGYFSCYSNHLRSLKYAPKFVGDDFDCSHNYLRSLKGAPKFVGGGFSCSYNEIKFTEEDVLKVSNVNGRIFGISN